MQEAIQKLRKRCTHQCIVVQFLENLHPIDPSNPLGSFHYNLFELQTNSQEKCTPQMAKFLKIYQELNPTCRKPSTCKPLRNLLNEKQK